MSFLDAHTSQRRRAKSLCLAGIALSGIYSLVLIPVAPSLLGTNPVLLEALRGSIPAMVTAGAFARVGQASLLLAVLAPLPTLMVFDPLFWWAGRLWGPEAGQMLLGSTPRARRRAERWLGRVARFRAIAIVLAPFLPIPSALIYAVAGWTGMRLWRFLALDALGALSWIGVNVGLGYAIGHSAVSVAKAISRYGLIVTLVLVAVIVLVSYRRTQREQQAAAAARAPEPSPAPEG